MDRQSTFLRRSSSFIISSLVPPVRVHLLFIPVAPHIMSVMSPAPTPAANAHVGTANTAEAAESSTAAQLRADVERTLLKLSQDLYEMEICAGDVVTGQEDRVPGYMSVQRPRRPSALSVRLIRFDCRREIDRSLIRLQEMSARLGDTVPLQVVE